MTDAEIVALVAREIHQRFPLVLKYEAENLASVAVAALTEAGRLVSDGCVAINAGRWERVRKAAWGWAEWVRLCDLNDAAAEDAVIAESLTAALQPGDLDAEPTP